MPMCFWFTVVAYHDKQGCLVVALNGLEAIFSSQGVDGDKAGEGIHTGLDLVLKDGREQMGNKRVALSHTANGDRG